MTKETKNIMAWTKNELLSLPQKNWDASRVYNSVMIVPTRKLHEAVGG